MCALEHALESAEPSPHVPFGAQDSTTPGRFPPQVASCACVTSDKANLASFVTASRATGLHWSHSAARPAH